MDECPRSVGARGRVVEGAEDELADLAGHGVEDQEEKDGDQRQHQQ